MAIFAYYQHIERLGGSEKVKKPAYVIFEWSLTEIFWQTFWHNKWRSVFDVVKKLCFFGQNKFDEQTKTNKWHVYIRNHITYIVTDKKNWPKGIYKYFCVLYRINTIREYLFLWYTFHINDYTFCKLELCPPQFFSRFGDPEFWMLNIECWINFLFDFEKTKKGKYLIFKLFFDPFTPS